MKPFEDIAVNFIVWAIGVVSLSVAVIVCLVLVLLLIGVNENISEEKL